MGVCLPIEFEGDGELRGTQEGRLGMKSINWRKDLKECAAEEGGNEQMHVPGWGGQRAGRKTSLGGITEITLRTRNNTTGVARKANIPLKSINRCVAYTRDEVMWGHARCLARALWPYLGTLLGREPSALCRTSHLSCKTELQEGSERGG